MEVTAVSSAASLAVSTPTARTSGTTSFSAALGDQRRRAAANDVMTSMPPMVAEQIQRSSPGGKPPVGAVDALFKAIQSGEFRPSAEQLAASDSLIATTARAVQSFDSAEQMWDTMREVLGAVPSAAGSSYLTAAPAAAEPATPPPATVTMETTSTNATKTTPAPAATSTAAPPAAIATRAQAEAVIGSPLTALQLNWWETAIHFLLDDARAASLRTAQAPVAPAPKPSTPAAAPAPAAVTAP